MVRNVNSIFLPLDSYLYLHELCTAQRSGRTMSDNHRKWLETNFHRVCCKSNGMYNAMDGYLGGAVGKPQNSYEDRRWTTWSVEDMKNILDAAGLSWAEGPTLEVITF